MGLYTTMPGGEPGMVPSDRRASSRREVYVTATSRMSYPKLVPFRNRVSPPAVYACSARSNAEMTGSPYDMAPVSTLEVWPAMFTCRLLLAPVPSPVRQSTRQPAREAEMTRHATASMCSEPWWPYRTHCTTIAISVSDEMAYPRLRP